MKLTDDPKQNVAYIYLRNKTAEVQTIRVSDELNVDLAPDGTIFGIKLLNAERQLATDKDSILTVVNEISGKIAAIELPA